MIKSFCYTVSGLHLDNDVSMERQTQTQSIPCHDYMQVYDKIVTIYIAALNG
jgi:hypothetical protein